MKTIRIPMIIQDPSTAVLGGLPRFFEGYDATRPFFLDGPVTKNVAVLDFDPDTGFLRQGVHYNSGEKLKKVRGYYENSDGLDLYKIEDKDLYSPEFMQISVFATVLRTIDMFEKTEEKRYSVLGRPLEWAFDGEQLFIIPDAGTMANAFYERESHSLQFFHFPSLKDPDRIIYSCLSRDIVAHETGHAIIDGIAPDLMNNCTPESIALHESIADLTALLVAFSSHNLRKIILKKNDGSIRKPSEFTYIAEEFGIGRGHIHGLRDLLNKKVLDQNPKSRINKEPHELSEVISGALYEVIIRIHENLKQKYSEREIYMNRVNPLFSASGEALMRSADRFKQMIFRALDFLPPGEVSFSDYYRAITAVDEIAYPEEEYIRKWLGEAFSKRNIISIDQSEKMDASSRAGTIPIKHVDINNIYNSDWAAYKFVMENLKLFKVPEGVSFKVHPRLEVKKKNQNETESHECIFKVSWTIIEKNDLGDDRIPDERRIIVGTTLVLDWNDGHILSLLTSAPPNLNNKDLEGSDYNARKLEFDRLYNSRNEFLKYLLEEGLLKIGNEAVGPDGKILQSTVYGQIVNNTLRVRGTTNLLHII